jgi:hypothetical protein
MPRSAEVQTVHSEKEFVVSKALINAAQRLRVSNAELAGIVGCSEATLSRFHHQKAALKEKSKSYELALHFIRLFRSLDSIVGGDDESAVAWLHADNLALKQKPIERIQSIEGLIDVVAYLDSRRAVI